MITISRRAMLAGAACLAPGAARAAWPERPLRWIVPYAAGGGSDVLARLVGAELGKRIGQPVVIENRPGGATNIGAEAAATSPADGYAVLTADNGTLVFNPALFRRLPYDADRDFRPVGLLARFPLVLAVKKDSPFISPAELVAGAKAAPGRLSYGSAGIGSPHHLAFARIVRETGIDMTHVPYRGAAPALTDLVAGTIDALVIDLVAGGATLRGGGVKPLAVLSAEPVDGFPQLPTIAASLGLAGFTAYAWQGMVTQRGVADEIADRLSVELAATLRDEGVAKRLREIGVEPLPGGAAEFRALLEAERAIWPKLIREANITLE